MRTRWRSSALTAVPAALLLGVLAWPSLQEPPEVTPSEVPVQVTQRAEPPAARPVPPRQRARAGHAPVAATAPAAATAAAPVARATPSAAVAEPAASAESAPPSPSPSCLQLPLPTAVLGC